MAYTLKVSRRSSGMVGVYPTFDEAATRLKEYGESFPDQIIEATITKNETFERMN